MNACFVLFLHLFEGAVGIHHFRKLSAGIGKFAQVEVRIVYLAEKGLAGSRCQYTVQALVGHGYDSNMFAPISSRISRQGHIVNPYHVVAVCREWSSTLRSPKVNTRSTMSCSISCTSPPSAPSWMIDLISSSVTLLSADFDAEHFHENAVLWALAATRGGRSADSRFITRGYRLGNAFLRHSCRAFGHQFADD